MLGLAHTLVLEELVDREFLDRYTTGYERFEAYLLGKPMTKLSPRLGPPIFAVFQLRRSGILLNTWRLQER
ncbi:MAG: hypothetical protein CM1200mP18_05270 [Gammaproteobacteria bacterium]|nr:MAG: hypothetical protein CM1200mP18_05270 [Gammaproteobacteria bacterium]